MDGVNAYLSLGKHAATEVKFKIVFNFTIEESLDLIQKRISGASQDVRRIYTWTYNGQLPKKENAKIYHRPLKELGRGAFGKVFKTVDMHNGNVVAVKQLDPHPELLVSRDREINALSRFKHPYIMPLDGWYTSLRTGCTELFMPIMQGTLDDLMLTCSSSETGGIGNTSLLQMLSALDYLAYKGFIHRDVKPENILYQTNHLGKYDFKLADFGISNTVAAARTPTGTPIYTAPEIHADPKYQTPKADIWSLFITMLWVFNVGQFRSILNGRGPAVTRVQVFAMGNAITNPEVEHMRNMAIFDPKYRASAAQMLAHMASRIVAMKVVVIVSLMHLDEE
ncbi:kinase-like domain-containing protein [Hypoxylon sp. FL1150]|nr:kinase-like domain-containing protein [Hypoxylon sp. FL1150]